MANMKCMDEDEELRRKQNSTLDYERYFFTEMCFKGSEDFKHSHSLKKKGAENSKQSDMKRRRNICKISSI